MLSFNTSVLFSNLSLYSGAEWYELGSPNISFCVLSPPIESEKWLLLNNIPEDKAEKLQRQIWLIIR